MRWGGKRRSESFFVRNGAMLLAKRVAYWGILAQPITVFSEAELLAATDNYRHIITEGFMLKTFKGRLPSGPSIAVEFPRWSIDEQVIEKIAILSGISHQNVVKFLGCCLETDNPMLVTEFVSGGTLHQRLELSWRGVRPLMWVDRVRIAGEVADALNYLHTFSLRPIVHRAVGTENVLLDEQGTAKITAFHRAFRSESPAGRIFGQTLGFCIDRDYLLTGILDEKCDVYGFGILVLTLLVGKDPSSVPFEYEGYSDLLTLFTSYMQQGQLIAVLEPIILAEGRMEDILLFAEIALRCVQRTEDRPTMKDVVRDIWQINCTKH